MSFAHLRIAALLGSVVASVARAQNPSPHAQPTPGQQQDYELLVGASAGTARDDYYEDYVRGGFRLRVPRLGLTIAGENLLILKDLETWMTAMTKKRGSGPPQRGIESPAPRRRLSPDAVRQRMQRTLAAIGQPRQSSGEPGGTRQVGDEALQLFRYLYCEGDIVVVQNGVEVVRCDRLWISPLDDRIVVENAELRYQTNGGSGPQTLIVRGPRLVKQGPRWTGSDVLLTTCTAATPHAALSVGEVEIIERQGEFEVITRGQSLQFGGVDVLPLPNARFFTGSQSEFPIKGATFGYQSGTGTQLGVVFGLPWNQTGGALHEFLTGRPANEFRGSWELGVGWIEKRGMPLDARVTYGAAGVYEGWVEGFFLDDYGRNLREINVNRDGSFIADDSRGLVRTANRVFLGENTHLDLQAFRASDAAVYSEFFTGPYRNDELPETSAYLHHADGNHLLTVGTRFNLDDFSYRDDRWLAGRFIEEKPVVTYQWLAQPVAKTPWQTPIVLDLETQIGLRQSDWDRRTGIAVDDETLRADQHAEISVPFRFGAFSVRPYLNGRVTFYDNTPDVVGGGDETRVAFEGGVQIGTRLSRTWSWIEDGERDAIRHVIAPKLTYRNRFQVDQRPGTLFQFDSVDTVRLNRLGYNTIDTLDERELLRFEVRNLVQKMNGGNAAGADRGPRDFVYVDLAQDVYPNANRDNAGDSLGLFFYDVLLRPNVQWLPFDEFALAVYGDLDWQRGMRTFDTELQFGQVFGIDWALEYREDYLYDGAAGIGAATRLFDRWTLGANVLRDLETDRWLAYNFRLQRDDHDWSLVLSANYNPFVEEVTFRIEFVPRFGFIQARQNRFGGQQVTGRSFDY
ncbi:MAG TPA: LPS-assembly protein LptD [bacterium]|nr:LPS-assembly protein LptD [bacterium]